MFFLEVSMPSNASFIEEIRRLRDEAKLKIHLGSKDLRDQWERLEKDWTRFEQKAQLNVTGKEVADALKTLGSELREGYERIRKAF
jgi:hypothetical protein